MEDDTLWRSQTYALLARLFISAPDRALLENLARLDIAEPDSPMGQAWTILNRAAQSADINALPEEYHTVFIGVTHGELIPYGSYYQTGFLMEEPLVVLRQDLARLGLERQDDKAEPEDHIAAVCDVMRLILQMEGTPVITAAQFFTQHLQPWVLRFCQDLATAKSAHFYQAVGQFATVFFELEIKRIGD